LAAADCTHAVVEVSRDMLARQSLAGVEAATVAVTNLAPGRGRHGATRAHAAFTDRILGMLGPGSCLVTGTPSAAIDRLRRRATRNVPGVACLSAGLRPECDLHAIPVERNLGGQIFLLRAGGETVPVAVATPTASFVADALVAAAVGLRCGATLERIARGIEAAGSVPGRMERLDRGQDLPVFLDAPTSGHALAATVRSLRRLTAGRLAVVADERWVRSVGTALVRSLARRCDACVVVPSTMLAEDAEPGDVAAYARLDRLLGGLGRRDCLLVLGEPRLGSGPAGGPDDGEHSLAAAVDGWLQLANPPRPPVGRRAA
jgi:UDP-N-acetylmuramoyl-L-alanyl-D-glutamate--2,6-diaminopimelate ligase